MALSVAIDIGGTKMLAGLVDERGDVVNSERVNTAVDRYLTDLGDLVGRMIDEARRRGEQPLGIGVGTTGLVDHESGTLVRSMNLGLENVEIKRCLEQRFELPTSVDNDIRAATLGELQFGVGRCYDDLVLLNVGTGIAAGMVFGGRLYRGATNTAGEIGHTSVSNHGPECRCGLIGCLETIIVDLRAGGSTGATGLPTGVAPPSPIIGYVALGLVHLVNILNPAAIVLAGGMLTGQPEVIPWIQATVRRSAIPDAVRGLKWIGLTRHGRNAGLIGAAALVLETNDKKQGRPTA